MEVREVRDKEAWRRAKGPGFYNAHLSFESVQVRVLAAVGGALCAGSVAARQHRRACVSLSVRVEVDGPHNVQVEGGSSMRQSS